MQRLLLGTAVDEPHLPIVVQNRPRAVGHRRGEPPAHARTGKAHEAAELPDSGNAGEGLRFPRADGEWSGLRGKPPRPHAGQRCGVRVPQHGNASAGERDPTRRTPRPPPRPGPASRHLGWRGLVWGRPALVDGWSPYLDASRRKAAVADAHAGVRDDRPEPAGLCSGSRRPITTSSRRRRSQGREPASFGDRYVPMPTSFPSRPATPRRRSRSPTPSPATSRGWPARSGCSRARWPLASSHRRPLSKRRGARLRPRSRNGRDGDIARVRASGPAADESAG